MSFRRESWATSVSSGCCWANCLPCNPNCSPSGPKTTWRFSCTFPILSERKQKQNKNQKQYITGRNNILFSMRIWWYSGLANSTSVCMMMSAKYPGFSAVFLGCVKTGVIGSNSIFFDFFIFKYCVGLIKPTHTKTHHGNVNYIIVVYRIKHIMLFYYFYTI